MIYEWRCSLCSTHVDVHRTVEEHKNPPTYDEGKHFTRDGDFCTCTEWVRVYKSSTPFETLRDKGVLDRLPMH